VPQHGHERDARIDRRANPDPPRDETEDGVMDMEKKDEEAGEEKEEGEMEKRRQGFYSPGKMQLFDAFGEERADARTLVRAVSRAGDLDVSARPLMQSVARSAQVRLIAKLRNQSELTQMAYRGGLNGGGLARVEGTESWDPLAALAISWYMLAR